MAKARCTHGVFWYLHCWECEDRINPEDNDYWDTRFPFWRNMTAYDVESYIRACARKTLPGGICD